MQTSVSPRCCKLCIKAPATSITALHQSVSGRTARTHTALPPFQLDFLTATADISSRLQVLKPPPSLLHHCIPLSSPSLCSTLPSEGSNASISLTADAYPFYCPHKYSWIENNELVGVSPVLSWSNVTIQVGRQLYVQQKGWKWKGKRRRRNGQD